MLLKWAIIHVEMAGLTACCVAMPRIPKNSYFRAITQGHTREPCVQYPVVISLADWFVARRLYRNPYNVTGFIYWLWGQDTSEPGTY